MLTKIVNCRAYIDLNKCVTILDLLKLESRSLTELQIYFSNDTIITLNLEDTLNLFEVLDYVSVTYVSNIKYFKAIDLKYDVYTLAKDILHLLIRNKLCVLHRIDESYYVKIDQKFFAIRNLLSLSEIIHKSELNKLYKIDITHSNHLKGIFKKVSKEQFQKQLEKQNELGEKAEKYVLDYENNRLNFSKEIKHIALEDNNAGYDIASFLNEESLEYNKFIEVKCYSLNNDKFYISKNEKKKSKELGKNYFLYLVDSNFDSNPLIIQNPYDSIFNNAEIVCEVESMSYEISHLIEQLNK